MQIALLGLLPLGEHMIEKLQLPSEIEEYKIPWGPIGKKVYQRSYAHEFDDKTKETWPHTVVRAVTGNLNLVDSKFIEPNEKDKLIKLLLEFGIMPAGRHLYASGIKGRQHIFNCHTSSYDPKNPSLHFEFLFDQLMQGGGVGANYSNRYMELIPKIAAFIDLHIVCSQTHPNYNELAHLVSSHKSSRPAQKFVVEDSREGWSKAAKFIFDSAFFASGEASVEIDLSGIRERGKPLKTSGGTACGPAPLAIALTDITKHLNGCVGRNLSSSDVMTLDHLLASCVIAGGKRRSSRMSLKSWKDQDIFAFINCKREDGSQWTTNISVEVDNEFFSSYKNGDQWAKDVMRAVTLGMRANGEPGFWNISLSREGERNPEATFSTNPCQPGWAEILTPTGRKTISDVSIGDVIWSGKQWTKITNKICTGVKQVNAYITDNGTFNGTENHRVVCNGIKVEVKDAKYIDASPFPNDAHIVFTSNKITKIESLGEQEVFDLTVEADEHTYWTDGLLVSNCGEIALSGFEACNLGHVNMAHFANRPGMQEAFRLMARWLVRATFSDIPSKVQREVVDANRRIGVGFFGLHEWLALNGIKYSEAFKNETLIELLSTAKATVIKEASNYATQLGIPTPVKFTALAPTGTTASLPGTTTGIQCMIAPWFKRLVRYAETDKELEILKTEGYTSFKDPDSRNTEIVTFWCEDPLVAKVRNAGFEDNILEAQSSIDFKASLSLQEMVQAVYADNAISYTVNLEPETMPTEEEMENTIIEFMPNLKGITVYPNKSRRNAPIQPITKEEFTSYNGQKEVAFIEDECKGACPIR